MSSGKHVDRKGEERVGIARLAFKGFLALVQEGKDVPMLDADDGQRYTLRSCIWGLLYQTLMT